jgi:hypothetical protein
MVLDISNGVGTKNDYCATIDCPYCTKQPIHKNASETVDIIFDNIVHV